MWRGEFERDGISVLALPPRDHLDRLVERTGLYRNEFDKNIERQIERVILKPDLKEKWKRSEIFNGVLGINHPTIGPPPNITEEQYEILAKTPLSEIESYKVEVYLEDLWIARNDFGAWVKRNWALPKFWFLTEKMDAQVSESKRRRGRSDNKQDKAERRNKYEMIFAAVRKKWDDPKKYPTSDVMTNYILENKLSQGLKRSAVRQLMLGTYPPALRLGIKL
ncbi:MAG: hypothetical protein HOB37_13650 [Rhodospirillaceae bacterium]|nr:hypothetical protein [Rhodospirillaceae bacterium]